MPHTHSLPWFCRWQFAPIIVAISTGAGALVFWGLNRTSPYDDLDIGYYACVFCSVGFTTGAAAWYLSRLIAYKHFPLRVLGAFLVAAYVFVALLALDKNPPIAVVAAVAFGFIFFLAWMAARRRLAV